jgi:hypothetical protein
MTHSKRTPPPKPDHRSWGGQYWPRNPGLTTITCASNGAASSTSRVDFSLRPLHTHFPECGSEATAPPRNPTPPTRSLAKHPTTGQYVTFVSATASAARLRTAASHRRLAGAHSSPAIRPASKIPVATQLIISNRSACRLEMPESYRKQTTATCSNRHKCSVSFRTCSPTSSRAATPRHPAILATSKCLPQLL